MANAKHAVWFDLDSLIDPSVTEGRVPYYGAPDTGRGHLALADNGWKNQVALYALQGLVNRRGPLLMYDTQFWNLKPADQIWRDYYTKEKNVTFETIDDMMVLIDRFRDEFRGLVVHDPDVEQTVYLACTVAGLDDLLPVTPELADELTERYPDLPIVHDLVGRWSDELTPLDEAIEEFLPRCTRGIIYSVDNLWSGMSIHTLDYAVGRRAFVFRCSPNPEYREDARRLHRIHQLAGPNCGVYGWGEPEHRYTEVASMNSNYVMCTEAPNLSFHAQIPNDVSRFQQKSHIRISDLELEEDKCYVAFMMSEGDALKIHLAFQGGAWHDDERGQLPINWGFQPRLIDVAPAMAEYYYRTMSENDYFFCGCSGAGHTYPNWMAEPDEFFRETDDFLARADLQVVDSWMHFSRPVYDRFAEVCAMAEAFTMPCGPGQVKMTAAGKPVILRHEGLNYFPNDATPQDLATAIRKAAERNVIKPAFITVYVVPNGKGNNSAQGGFGPGDFLRVMELLGEHEFKAVTLEEMAWAAKEFARRYPDRIDKPMGHADFSRVGVNVMD